MKRVLICSAILMMPCVVAAAPAATSGAPVLRVKLPGSRTAVPQMLHSISRAKGLKSAGLDLKNHTCVFNSMTCNSTISGMLTTHDCLLPDGTFIDFWVFQGSAGSTVTIDVTSTEFNTFLSLLDPSSNVAASDSFHIVHTLDVTGSWTIVVNGLTPADLGDYTLTLDCAGVTPNPPAAPSNLSATTSSSTEIELDWQDNSNNEDEFRVELREPDGVFEDIGSVPSNSTAATVIELEPATTYTFRVRARNSTGDSAYSNEATATTFAANASCTPSATNLCLNNGRFQVEVDWRDFESQTGQATVVLFGSDDSGLFYFFDPDNWEMLVKVLDACDSPFNSFWVFAAATTNVEYTLRVTDTQTGVVKQYFNPLGTASPAVTDTSAFATCP